MKNAALWLGAVAVATSLVVSRPVSAAEMFADVPTDHWAYQAVNRLQERGIVIGYPDGTFGGKRAMTRYEFAVAVDRLVEWATRSMSELESRVGNKGPGTPGLTRDEVQGMIDDATRDLARKEDLRQFATREDVETIRRLAEEFRDELASLGTNVETLRRDLDSLKARVGAIEERLNRWNFSGEANLVARGEHGSNVTLPPGATAIGKARVTPIDLDSRYDSNSTNNILQDLKTLYSLDFGVTGNLGGGATANALLNFGNYLPWVNTGRANPGVSNAAPTGPFGVLASDVSHIENVGNFQGPGALVGRVAPGPSITQGAFGKEAVNTSYAEFTPLKLYLNSPVRDLWFLKNIDLTVGKFGVQFTPYTLRKVDPDSYTNITLTDNGEYIATGATGRATVLGVDLQGYAAGHYTGRVSDTSVNAGDPVYISWGGPPVLSAMTYGAYPWDQSAGVRGNYKLGRFNIGGTYISAGITPNIGNYTAGVDPEFTDPTTYANRPNSNNGGRRMVPRRAEVYGADIHFPIAGRLAIAGEFAGSTVLAGFKVGDRKSVYPSNLRFAYDAKLTWGSGRLNVAAGYKRVDPFFGAPGAWGNIGRWKNPTNIKGFQGSAGYNFGGFTLKGGYEDYRSVRVNGATARIPAITALYPATTVDGVAGVGPNLTDAFKNKIQHYTVGLSFNLTPTNAIDLGWEQARIRPFDVAGKSKENYYTVGLGHRFSENTLVKVLYQFIDYKDNGAGLYTLPFGEYKGGVGVTQLSVRF